MNEAFAEWEARHNDNGPPMSGPLRRLARDYLARA
jgi:hypothetical protein